MHKKQIKTKRIRTYFGLKDINAVIKLLTLSDLAIISGFALLSPIFAIFITDSIQGGSVKVAGIASSIYLITKSLGQIPTANYIDKKKGEFDDFLLLIIGTFLFSFIPLLYLAIEAPWQLYIIQAFYGISSAITLPTWYAVFTRHIDKEHEGIEWGVYQTLIDLGGGVAAFVGGLIAANYGFDFVFILVSVMSFAGLGMLFGINKYLKRA